MKISIITVFPQIYDSFLKVSLVARAIEKKLIKVKFIRFSDMIESTQRIDEPTCGPGAGMIIKPDVIQKAIEKSEKEWGKAFKIFFSPQGKKLSQPMLKHLAKNILKFEDKVSSKSNISESDSHIILVCSRYEGIDDRVLKYYADLVISIGDYVVMGGDIPAQIFLEGLLRLLPGVVGKKESVEQESFSSAFFDYPQYGLPVEWKEMKVPEMILSGNHAQIEKWRKDQAAKKTIENRFDWFISSKPTSQEIDIAKKFIPNHYVALMHTQVLVQDGVVGNSSIASLDIHDIARSCATYDVKNYFIVTPLKDQQNILNSFLQFWRSDEGKEYNLSRYQAIEKVVPSLSLSVVMDYIKKKEDADPIIISTSARFKDFENKKWIDFFSQGRIFKKNRPVLILFGTGQGLCDQIIEKSDFLLQPVIGLTNYNHLSVRSAASIVLDRWLGVNFKSFFYR
ncbi:tRNA (guanosine(37)-N1)-methyltransferase TrmD [Candidatus Babeliales bacterium]|nr:tRNA (guanosine(37)-N1)-methyltransferase TrmD [Candidatus Babeliales bacterium]